MIAELNKYDGLPNGMFSCDEHLAGLNPTQGSGVCTVVEYMFSLEQSLAIVGDPAFGDARKTWLQRAARHLYRRHVGSPVQPGTQPGGVQPSPEALDYRRAGIQSLRTRAQLRLLHCQLPSGLAQVCQQSFHGVRRARPPTTTAWSRQLTRLARFKRCCGGRRFMSLKIQTIHSGPKLG